MLSVYDAVRRGDEAAVHALLDPGVEIHEAPSMPYGGVFRGHQGWTEVVAALFATWQDYEVSFDLITSSGEHVVALLRLRGRIGTSADPVEMPLAEVWRVRDGRVTELRPYYWDTAELARLAAS